MAELKIRQLEFERDSWKRLLEFILDENIYMKSRLNEIVKNIVDKAVLENMEHFQNRFLKQDELIGLLRNNIVELDQLLVRELLEEGKIKKQLEKHLLNLRSNILTAQAQFTELKMEFNDYLFNLVNDSSRLSYISAN